MSFQRHIRRKVFEKYSGHCAYCGSIINFSSFQVDHFDHDKNNNHISNLNPSCRVCNFYKSDLPIEDFRKRITSILYVIQHKTPKSKLLSAYNLIDYNPAKIVFYFEKFQQCRNCGEMELNHFIENTDGIQLITLLKPKD